jgi:hypothetical protein
VVLQKLPLTLLVTGVTHIGAAVDYWWHVSWLRWHWKRVLAYLPIGIPSFAGRGPTLTILDHSPYQLLYPCPLIPQYSSLYLKSYLLSASFVNSIQTSISSQYLSVSMNLIRRYFQYSYTLYSTSILNRTNSYNEDLLSSRSHPRPGSPCRAAHIALW